MVCSRRSCAPLPYLRFSHDEVIDHTLLHSPSDFSTRHPEAWSAMLSPLGQYIGWIMSPWRVSCLLCLCLSGVLRAPLLRAVPVTTCSSACQAAQVSALVDLYAATQGSQWVVSAGWSSLTPATPIATVCAVLDNNLQGWCCDSTKSRCPAEYGIGMLILYRNNLKGTLPASLFTALGPTLLSVILSSMELKATKFRCLEPSPVFQALILCTECR